MISYAMAFTTPSDETTAPKPTPRTLGSSTGRSRRTTPRARRPGSCLSGRCHSTGACGHASALTRGPGQARHLAGAAPSLAPGWDASLIVSLAGGQYPSVGQVPLVRVGRSRLRAGPPTAPPRQRSGLERRRTRLAATPGSFRRGGGTAQRRGRPRPLPRVAPGSGGIVPRARRSWNRCTNAATALGPVGKAARGGSPQRILTQLINKRQTESR